MIHTISASNLSQWTRAMDQTAQSIQKITTTEQESPENQTQLITNMVDLIRIPHAMGYSIKVIKTYDQMIGDLLDIRAK